MIAPLSQIRPDYVIEFRGEPATVRAVSIVEFGLYHITLSTLDGGAFITDDADREVEVLRVPDDAA